MFKNVRIFLLVVLFSCPVCLMAMENDIKKINEDQSAFIINNHDYPLFLKINGKKGDHIWSAIDIDEKITINLDSDIIANIEVATYDFVKDNRKPVYLCTIEKPGMYRFWYRGHELQDYKTPAILCILNAKNQKIAECGLDENGRYAGFKYNSKYISYQVPSLLKKKD